MSSCHCYARVSTVHVTLAVAQITAYYVKRIVFAVATHHSFRHKNYAIKQVIYYAFYTKNGTLVVYRVRSFSITVAQHFSCAVRHRQSLRIQPFLLGMLYCIYSYSGTQVLPAMFTGKWNNSFNSVEFTPQHRSSSRQYCHILVSPKYLSL